MENKFLTTGSFWFFEYDFQESLGHYISNKITPTKDKEILIWLRENVSDFLIPYLPKLEFVNSRHFTTKKFLSSFDKNLTQKEVYNDICFLWKIKEKPLFDFPNLSLSSCLFYEFFKWLRIAENVFNVNIYIDVVTRNIMFDNEQLILNDCFFCYNR